MVFIYGKSNFPTKIKHLRKEKLESIDELVLVGIEKKYFGWFSLFKNFLLYTAAMFMILMVALSILK